MPLQPGTKLGPYEITASLGAGGMGEVYRARDARLNRDVAVKILPEYGDRSRFQTEARALAALSHPNIIAIYDVGDNYLVTELVDGVPMKASGLRSAIDLVAQTAEGLAAAHGIGIFHRDIKPQNLLVTGEGRVKIIDFGLAKDSEPSDGAATITATGTVMGTAPYMSPEQVRGLKLDARSDLFSLGAVLYELLSGHRPFQGEAIAQTMAAILDKEPADLPDSVPAALRQIVYRCLAKDRAARFQNAGDLAFALRALGAGSSGHTTAMASVPVRATKPWGWVAAAVMACATVVALWAPWRKSAELPPMARLVVESPAELGNSNNAGSAISPDGKMLAFVALAKGGPSIYVRALDSLEARLLSGTEGAGRPFWSADNKTVAYFNGSKLMRMELAGGAPQPICNASTGRGGTWNKDGVIVFGTGTGSTGGQYVLRRVNATGGEPTAITEMDQARKEDAHYYPQFLPDGKHFLYFRRTTDRDNSGVYVGSLDDPDRGRKDRLILRTKHRAIFAPAQGGATGHLIQVRGVSLYSQPFDLANFSLSGDAAVLSQEVFQVPANGFADVSASANGIVTYSTGGDSRRMLIWRDRTGKQLGAPHEFAEAISFNLSRDARKVVSSRADAQVGDSLWVTDLERNTTSRLMFETAAIAPVFSPDGEKVAFSSRSSLFLMPADGSGKAEEVLKLSSTPFLAQWSPDGRYLVYSAGSPADVWALPLAGDRKPILLVGGKPNELGGAVAFDSRWLAYVSDETGRSEVYVQAFPEPKGKWMVSVAGGGFPKWRADGKELVYVDTITNSLMAVSIQDTGRGIVAGKPVELFPKAPIRTVMTDDGKRFLASESPDSGARRPIVVLMNWQR